MRRRAALAADWWEPAIFERIRIEDPKDLITLKKYTKAFHGKFYNIDESCNETRLAYEKAVPVLMEAGFDCAINAEYEGQRAKQHKPQPGRFSEAGG